MSISVGGLVLAVANTHYADTILLGFIAVAVLVVGWVGGAVRPQRIAGPVRLPLGTPALPFASVLFGSFGFFIFAASGLQQMWPWLSNRFFSQSSEAVQSELLAAITWCIPPIVGLLGVWLGDRAVFPVVRQKLGMSAKLLPRGIFVGVLASVIVIPLTFFASDITERAYRSFSYQHDSEHPLLRAVGEAPSLVVRAALVIGACVIAPIWEEMFFRGHLQTLLRRMFGRLLGGSSNERHSALVVWAAVIATSVMFAIMHPFWSVPTIFLLSLCLGYAYERTGNLWIAIAMHATFNIVNTSLSLTHGATN